MGNNSSINTNKNDFKDEEPYVWPTVKKTYRIDQKAVAVPEEEVPDVIASTQKEHPDWNYTVLGVTGPGSNQPQRVDFYTNEERDVDIRDLY